MKPFILKAIFAKLHEGLEIDNIDFYERYRQYNTRTCRSFSSVNDFCTKNPDLISPGLSKNQYWAGTLFLFSLESLYRCVFEFHKCLQFFFGFRLDFVSDLW